MSVPANIDQFNRVVLVLFDELYSKFPAPQWIDSNDIAKRVLEKHPVVGGDGWEHHRLINVVGYAVDWLKHEGFIRSTDRRPDVDTGTLPRQFSDMTLTWRGVALMGAPKSLRRGRAMSDKVREALAKGTQGAAADAVKDLLSEGRRMAWRAAIEYVAGG